MKDLYLIGGTMGVGKSTICQRLKKELYKSVFLDGDWCWDMHPFVVNKNTKTIVLSNITHCLNNYIHCDQFEHIIFCWVMHEQFILDALLQGLDSHNCNVHIISLLIDPQELERRLQKDILAGLRDSDIIERSLAYLTLYPSLNTRKIDVSRLTIEETLAKIKEKA